jgi:endo-beta-N-acetylglucosaminidase D
MAYLLGWKDILRPIRDGYRHMFPTPDTGPTPEERRKQREIDKAKGFTYFDTFDQLESWTEANSDPLQRANTPLLQGEEEGVREESGKADVILIHDCSGNYHDYESAQNTGVHADSYTCEYLQHVDTFIYFSHKLICVPPPTWTNALHRNGVKVLGTVLVEPQTKGSERLLQHDTDEDGMHFPIVEKLAHIAAHYGFDGWLMNIEKPFPQDVWDPYLLETFLCQLKTAMGKTRQLVW